MATEEGTEEDVGCAKVTVHRAVVRVCRWGPSVKKMSPVLQGEEVKICGILQEKLKGTVIKLWK